MNTSYRLLILTKAALLATLLVAMASTAMATAPEAPVDFTAQSVVSPNSPDPTIQLQWKANPQGAAAQGYHIYIAKGANGAIGDFVRFATTDKTSFQITNLGVGVVYAFYVTAYNADGESKPSNTQQLVIDGGPDPSTSIHFITDPVREATVGVAYVYKAQAVAPNNATVRYKLTPAPLGAPIPYADGMTIDRQTGDVAWTPWMQGSFAAAIIAYLDADTTKIAMQVVIVTVKTPPCATIHGTVINADGSLVDNAYVTAVSADNNWSTSISTETVRGEYTLAVGQGTYLIYLKHPQVGAIWYKDAQDVSGAERVNISCGDNFTANFTVTMPPQPAQFTVSGRVTAKSDGHGVMAMVQFMTRDKNGQPPGPDNGTVYPSAIATKTDADGNYSVELTDQFSYIAEAIPEGDDLLSQYYNDVTNPTEATLISSTTKDAVNFSLASRPVYNNSISGTVKDSAGVGVESQVIAIRLPEANSGPDPVKNDFARAATTEANGTFTLKNLVPGDYVLLAIPNTRDLTPGYFVKGQMASLTWKDATRLTIDETSALISNDIMLGKRDGRKGFAKLNGYVKAAPGSTKSSDRTLGADQLPGVFVYALDLDGRVGDYTFSDPTGWFELSELGAGDYRIFADKVGYSSQVVATNLDYKGRASVAQDITMTRGTSSVGEAVVGQNSLSIYPNPADNRLTLRFDGNAGKASLTVVDALGRTVYAATVNAIDGTNSIAIDVSTFGAGSYRAQLRNAAMTVSTAFAIVR